MRKRKDNTPQNEVEEALLKRALGFQQSEEYCEDIIDKKSGEILETLKRKTVKKEILPDVRALLFWLKNRHSERWKERIDDIEDEQSLSFDSTDNML